MHLNIGDFSLALDIESDGILERLASRYGPFLEPAGGVEPAFRLALEIDASRQPAWLHSEHVDNPVVVADGGIDRAALSGDGFEGELDWERGSGRAVIPDSLAHLDLFVRVALGVGLLREGGTLLHASAVLRDRFGIAFSGPSGAGKSTIADLSRAAGLPVLADEMVVFRRSGLGFRFHGTPFWNGTRTSGPCGAVLFLTQADGHRVEHLAPAAALPLLLAAGGAPLALAGVQSAFFAACGEVLRRVPAYRLSFAKDDGFWDVLDRLPEFAYFRPQAIHASKAGSAPVPLGVLKRPGGEPR